MQCTLGVLLEAIPAASLLAMHSADCFGRIVAAETGEQIRLRCCADRCLHWYRRLDSLCKSDLPILVIPRIVFLCEQQATIAVRAVDCEAALVAIVTSEVTWMRTLLHHQGRLGLGRRLVVPKGHVIGELNVAFWEVRQIHYT